MARTEKMSKAADIRRAQEQEVLDRWKCVTCTAPAQERSCYCLSCELYWKDSLNWSDWE